MELGEVWRVWEILHFLRTNAHIGISMFMYVIFSQLQDLSLPSFLLNSSPTVKLNHYFLHQILQNSHTGILSSADGNVHLFGSMRCEELCSDAGIPSVRWPCLLQSASDLYCALYFVGVEHFFINWYYIYPFICLLYVSFYHNMKSMNTGTLFHSQIYSHNFE